jgi:hypothetical protein
VRESALTGASRSLSLRLALSRSIANPKSLATRSCCPAHIPLAILNLDSTEQHRLLQLALCGCHRLPRIAARGGLRAENVGSLFHASSRLALLQYFLHLSVCSVFLSLLPHSIDPTSNPFVPSFPSSSAAPMDP